MNSIAFVKNEDFKSYLKNNMKSGEYLAFGFTKLINNPFQTLIYGYGIAFYNTSLSEAAWIMATNGGIVECTQVSLA